MCPHLLQAADVLIHPAYRENTGTVLLEAAISGLPVLCSQICGYSRYIDKHQLGVVLAEPFSQAACNEALQAMLISEQRSIWKDNGLCFANDADIYDMPERAVDVIEATGISQTGVMS